MRYGEDETYVFRLWSEDGCEYYLQPSFRFSSILPLTNGGTYNIMRKRGGSAGMPQIEKLKKKFFEKPV